MKHISDNLRQYLELEKRLVELRAKYPDGEPTDPEGRRGEDDLLGHMDEMWYRLSPEEQLKVDEREPSEYGKGASQM